MSSFLISVGARLSKPATDRHTRDPIREYEIMTLRYGILTSCKDVRKVAQGEKMETYGPRYAWVNICILHGEWHTRTKTPSPIQAVDRPEQSDSICTVFFVGEILK